MGRRMTRPGRLALLDRVMRTLEADLLRRRDGPWADAPVVDVGIGRQPWTTAELAVAVAPLPVVGVDRSEEVLASARSHRIPRVSFVRGSFSLPVHGVRLIRVMNVLRDGSPAAALRAHARLGEALLEGGVLIEGSCAPGGEAGAAHWLRKTAEGLTREGLVLWLDGTLGMHPMVFRQRLPRDLLGTKHHPVFGMLDRWTAITNQLPASPDRLTAAAAFIEHLTPIPVEGGWAFKLAWP